MATCTKLGDRVYITKLSQKSHLYTVKNMEGVTGKRRQEMGGLGYCKHRFVKLVRILIFPWGNSCKHF